PVQRAVGRSIFEWENENGAGVRARLRCAGQHESQIYEDAPHTAIILDLAMRIAMDIRKINEFGVGTYIWNLVRNLAAIDKVNEYLLIGSRRNFHELGPLPPNFKQLYEAEEDGLW